MKRCFISWALIFLLISNVFADDYPRNENIDVLHYAFSLVLNEDNNEISGTTIIDARFLTDGVADFYLDLVGKLPGSSTGMTVLAVTAADEQLRFIHENNRLRIFLNSASIKQERRRFTISYSGIPEDGLIIAENKYGERTFFGDNWPNRARHWLPSVDHPYDKATCEFIITAPERYQVVANGLLAEESSLPDGMRLTHWKESVPIPAYCMVMGAARFAVQYVDTYDGISIQTWVYAQDREDGFFDFARSRRVIEFFSGFIGPFPYEKLANVQSKTRYGGMENAGNIFYSERSVTGQRRSENTIVHEIAHQWFGDSVTGSDWHHIWLSEGFATYFTHVFNEFTFGRDVMAERLQNDRKRIIRYYEQNPDSPVIDTTITELNRLLSTNSYQKGSWVLHMLRQQIGDESFRRGIREYYRLYRDGTALTEDFRRVMEETSDKELGWFFRQWLYQPGQPFLKGAWNYDPDNMKLTVSLEQAQTDGTFFLFPIDIGINYNDGTPREIKTFQIDSKESNFTVQLEKTPSSVLLDPNTRLLMQSEFVKKQ